MRFGLGAVKGAGEGAIRRFSRPAQALGGTITSLFALAEHIDLRLVNKKVLESLIKAGAFDTLAPAGATAIWRGGRACSPASIASSTTAAGIRGIATRASRSCSAATPTARRPARRRRGASAVPAWTETEALAFEKEALGLYMSGHPLQRYAEALDAAGAATL